MKIKFLQTGIRALIMEVTFVLSVLVITFLDGCYAGKALHTNTPDIAAYQTFSVNSGTSATSTTSATDGSRNTLPNIVHNRGRDVIICPDFSCDGRCQAHSASLTMANCFCDTACLFYGDCCFDAVQKCGLDKAHLSNHLWLTDQRPRCSNVFQNDFVLLIDHCHRHWPFDITRRKCENERVESDDVFSLVPVMHNESDIAFKNMDCALCNFIETNEIEFWFFNISCPDDTDLDTVKHGQVTLGKLESLQRMGCHVKLKPPVSAITDHVRYCNERFLDACESDTNDDSLHPDNRTGEEDSLALACGQYTAYVILEEPPFSRYVVKNTHCALCFDNSTDVANLTCPGEDDLNLDLNVTPFGRVLPPFSLILDFNGYHWQAESPITPPVEICEGILYNLTGNCREARCREGFQRAGEECLPIIHEDAYVKMELIENSPYYDDSILTDTLLGKATDHGIVVEIISVEPFTPNVLDCNGVSSESNAQFIMVDSKLRVQQNETTLLAVMLYIDHLIESTELDIVTARINNIELDGEIESVCDNTEQFSIAINGSQDVLVDQYGVEVALSQMAWEMPWGNHCVNGPLTPSTDTSVRGCVKQRASCLLVSVSESEVNSINKTMGQMLSDSSFYFEENKNYVCISILRNLLENNSQYVTTSQTAEAILTAVLLPISMVALLFTIITHCIVSRFNSLPGRVVVCLSVALLLAQALFLAVEAPVSIPWLCTTLAVVEHYLWLSTFTWSNILALDLEITLTRSNKGIGNRNKNNAFIKFSVYGWGASAVFVGVVVALSFLTSLPVRYGDGSVCWLMYREALLYGFALPVALAVIANCCLFSRAIFFVWKVGRLAKKASIIQDKRAKLFLYVKLVFLMGLTWLFGIMGTSLHSSALMYLFTIFNSLQGVYICVAFVCNKRVMRFYLRPLLKKKDNSTRLSRSQTSRTTSVSKV